MISLPNHCVEVLPPQQHGMVQLEHESLSSDSDHGIVMIPETVRRFADSRQTPIYQLNGQRIFGPRPNFADEFWKPEKGSEIFVGKLPRDCFEPELVPWLEQAGTLYQLRLMMDFSGTNRGYCFATYCTPEMADCAVRILNNSLIRPGRLIGVTKSVDNCRLLLSGVPNYKTEQEIFYEVSAISSGVKFVFANWHPDEVHAMGLGMVSVTYESHRAAAIARSKILTGQVQMWGFVIRVEWAQPEIQIPEHVIHSRKRVGRRVFLSQNPHIRQRHNAERPMQPCPFCLFC